MTTSTPNAGGLKTPDALANALRKLKEENLQAMGSLDKETLHSHADNLLVGTLRTLGYSEAMDIYENWIKWYA